MQKVYFMAVAILLSVQSFAQYSINGTVKDSASQPIPGATVRVLNTFKGGYSAANGIYQINDLPEGDYEIKVSAIGYESQTKSIGLKADYDLSFVLNSAIEQLDEVMISATRASEDAPFAKSEVQYADVEKSNLGQDLAFLLQNQVSLVPTSDAGAGIGYTGFRIRGSDATRINVTVNGIPINDPESQGVFWVNMPDFVSSTENIQIQRGVGASTNGAGAFGGTVNLQTLSLKKEPYAEISNSYGSFHSQKYAVKAGTGLLNDRWAVDARGSYIYSDGYIDRATSNLKSYYVSAGYYGDKTILKGIHFSGQERTYQSWWGTPESRINDDIEAMEAHALNNGMTSDQLENLINSGRTYNYYQYEDEVDNYGQDHFQLHFSHQFNDNLSANAALHYTHGEGYYEQFRNWDAFADYGKPDLTIGGQTISTTNLVRRRWLDNDLIGTTYSLKYNNDKLNFTFGGAYNQYDGDHFGEIIWATFANGFFNEDRYYDNNGFKTDFNTYVKADYKFSEKLAGFADLQVRSVGYEVAGIDNDLRELDFDTTFFFFNPKLGLNYEVSDDLRTYVSMSVANREPVRTDYLDNLSSEQPKHESMIDYELGMEYGKDKLTTLANIYYMSYTNQLVVTGALNDVGSVLRTNVDKSSRAGIELAAKYDVNNKVALSANTTISQNKIKDFTEVVYDYTTGFDIIENQFSNTDIALSPSTIGAVVLEVIPAKNALLMIQAKHVGKQYLDNTSNDERAIDAYQTIDARVSYSLFPKRMKELTLNLLVNNLFNAQYSSNGYTYGYVWGAHIQENFYYPQAGTNVLMGMTMKF